jgi:hypothetical protein
MMIITVQRPLAFMHQLQMKSATISFKAMEQEVATMSFKITL